jgi:hypothetical protein
MLMFLTFDSTCGTMEQLSPSWLRLQVTSSPQLKQSNALTYTNKPPVKRAALIEATAVQSGAMHREDINLGANYFSSE